MQFKLQLEKKTVPEPFSPLIHGSSNLCIEYNATFILLVALHFPILPFFLFILHFLGHKQQFSKIFCIYFLLLLLPIILFILLFLHTSFHHHSFLLSISLL